MRERRFNWQHRRQNPIQRSGEPVPDRRRYKSEKQSEGGGGEGKQEKEFDLLVNNNIFDKHVWEVRSRKLRSLCVPTVLGITLKKKQ